MLILFLNYYHHLFRNCISCFLIFQSRNDEKKNTIRDEGSTALKTAYTVDMVHTVDMVYTVDMIYTIDTVYIIQTALHCC